MEGLVDSYLQTKREMEELQKTLNEKRSKLVSALKEEALNAWRKKHNLECVVSLDRNIESSECTLKIPVLHMLWCVWVPRGNCDTYTASLCGMRYSIRSQGDDGEIVIYTCASYTPLRSGGDYNVLVETFPTMQKIMKRAPALFREYDFIEQHTDEYLRENN